MHAARGRAGERCDEFFGDLTRFHKIELRENVMLAFIDRGKHPGEKHLRVTEQHEAIAIAYRGRETCGQTT